MPKNYKAGPPRRKLRRCIICGEDKRAGKKFANHMTTEHPETAGRDFWLDFWRSGKGAEAMERNYAEFSNHPKGKIP